MNESATGSSLRAAVAVGAVVIAAFSSASLAQQAQTPPPSWHGTFEWKHFCQGGGSTDETRGIGTLELSYSAYGHVDFSDVDGNRHRPEWTLNGRLTGTIPERRPTIATCSFTYVAPGTFSANVVGSYTPAQNTFSATVYRVNSTPGRASWACPAGTTEADQPYFAVYEGPLFEDAFRELRRAPDGSLKSNGERTVSVGESTCTTTYALTLYGCGSHMPEHGMIYARTLGGRIHSEPSSNSSVNRLPAKWHAHAIYEHPAGRWSVLVLCSASRQTGRMVLRQPSVMRAAATNATHPACTPHRGDGKI